MGLFKKRSTEPGELDRLRSEIESMATRLAEADAQRDHLRQLDHRVHHLASRLDQPPEPSPPAPPAVDPADVDMLRARIQRLNEQLQQTDARAARPVAEPETVSALEARLDALQARLDATPPPPPPGPAAPGIDPADLDALRDRIELLDARLAAVDGRITSIATELANQLTELSNEIDGVANRPAVQPVADQQAIDIDMVDELVDELRDTQIRLANEQARYQIAFRQELAELAERLRRPGT